MVMMKIRVKKKMLMVIKMRVKRKVAMMMDVKVTSFSPAYAEFSPHCRSKARVSMLSKTR